MEFGERGLRSRSDILCPTPQTVCSICGIPADAQVFDDSSILDASNFQTGEIHTLAGFALRPQYCGILQYFAQFTEWQAKDKDAQPPAVQHASISTPGLEWSIRANGQPLSPYLRMEAIVNPWGYGSFPIARRLPDGALIELAVKSVPPPAGAPKPSFVGGRIMGKYWFNSVYGERDQEYGG